MTRACEEKENLLRGERSQAELLWHREENKDLMRRKKSQEGRDGRRGTAAESSEGDDEAVFVARGKG